MSKNVRSENQGGYCIVSPYWPYTKAFVQSQKTVGFEAITKKTHQQALLAAGKQVDDEVLERAAAILEKRLRASGAVMDSPGVVKTYLRLKLAEKQDEVFALMLLDTAHGLIGYHEVVTGTIDRAMIYGRSVARAWLEHNAGACILVHNHPSGRTMPSDDDMVLTSALVKLGEQLGVRVLDHMIVGGAHVAGEQEVYSFAEHGLI